MDKNKVPISGGLRKKLFLLCTMLVIVASVAFAAIGIIQLRTSMRVAAETSESQNETIKEQSQETLTRLNYENMLNTVTLTAQNVDGEFWTMKHDFTMLAHQVQDILEHPDKYGEREVHGPDAANAGKYVLQLMFADDETANDPETMSLIGKLANLEPIMAEIVRGNELITRDCYIALPNGTTLEMDTFSDRKFDENGNVNHYDPTTRPWYMEAVEKGEFCFTLAVHGYYMGIEQLQYGYPIYINDELAAVLQGSTALSRIQNFVSEVGVGENGFSILVSDEGQLVYSPRESGELEMLVDMTTDIRDTGNETLSALIHEALNQESGLGEVEIDGESYYAAYSRMPSLGWTMITFVPQSELEKPTEALLSEMDAISVRAAEQYSDSFKRSTLLLLAVVALLIINASVAAISLSGKITNPIHVMTKRIEDLSGDKFVFEVDDVYRTGDEIEILANTFGKLSEQMEEYLRNILAMTAEKERVGTELALATRIQADMLPNKFPPFPDRQEFNIYASMTPAKEVGGDFYDFFFVDEDRLALVIADVSGKGIPAAMFMMMAKNMIQTQAVAGHSPKEVLEAANELLCENNAERMFVTVWFGILDLRTGMLTAANAGHEYPILKAPEGSFEIFRDKHGFVLGGMNGMKHKEYKVRLDPGAKLFVYTDGVAEAMNADRELFGLNRTLEALNAAMDEPPEGILRSVDDAVARFVGDAEKFDDLTMLCIEFRGNNMKELTVDAKLESLRQVKDFVNGELEALDCPSETKLEFQIVIDELFGNIARYAYPEEAGSATVRFETEQTPRAVVLTFLDSGIPFDPLQKEAPDTSLKARERKIGGLGIFMVRELMDEVRYEYKQGQNVLRVRKQV
jgi:sigma-B regulation protein RsbU (phosphoserine phosphatase)